MVPSFPAPPAITATISPGQQLYSTSSPGQHCDTHGGTWEDYNGVHIECQNGRIRISNTAQVPTLQGTFLTQLPVGAYPSDYIVQAQMQPEKASRNGFGIYFRNQPDQQLGVYTFMMYSDGTWRACIYDNKTGNSTQLTGGILKNITLPATMTIVVRGQHFIFYANNVLLGDINDKDYPNGSTGIVVERGASVLVSNFVLYSTR